MTRYFIFLLSLTVFLSCNNSSEKAETKTTTEKTAASSDEVRVHICSEACKDGNHIFMHNEIGHTCSSDCGRPHVCAEKCVDNAHVYAHGELGHYCMCVPKS